MKEIFLEQFRADAEITEYYLPKTSLGKQNPEYTDFKYWNENGLIGKVRPWK